MRIGFIASEKEREQILARAFIDGVSRHGHDGVVLTMAEDARGCDVAAMVGVKSNRLWRHLRKAGVATIMIDKGYLRHRGPDRTWEYWRVAVGDHHPTRYLMSVAMPDDRMKAAGLHPAPWRDAGRHIVIAGSSAKYHAFNDLPEPTRWASALVRQLKGLTDRRIIYRPKPSWRDAVPISGTRYSGARDSLAGLLGNAHCLVTHGSNACFESVLAGVPCIVLGNAIARPISSTDIAEVESPRLADGDERGQWLANLLYQQWTLDEFRSGQAWDTIGEHVR